MYNQVFKLVVKSFKPYVCKMKYILLLFLFFLPVYSIYGQTVEAQYLDPKNGTDASSYKYIRVGNSANYWAGFMMNKTDANYGNGNDFSIFTYNSRDLTFRTGTGNVIFFPSSGGNVGIGTNSPQEKLHVNGRLRLGTHGSGSGSWYTASSGSDWFAGLNGENHWRVYKDGNKMLIDGNGNVGIGSSNPQSKMEVFDNAVHLNAHEANSLIIRSPYVGSTNDRRMVGMTLSLDTPERQHNAGQKSAGVFVQSTSSWGNNVDMLFYTSNLSFQERMRITSTGNVGIGTANPGSYKLAVEGKIGAHEIKVTTSGWADFVFREDYVLRPLADVETFIKEKGHLPDVPSEAEVLENGIEVGAMNATLLQKIEELTLYMIEMKKENERLKSRISALEDKQ